MAYVASRRVIYGVARMAQVFYERAGTFEAKVFDNIEEAREWLRVGEEATTGRQGS